MAKEEKVDAIQEDVSVETETVETDVEVKDEVKEETSKPVSDHEAFLEQLANRRTEEVYEESGIEPEKKEEEGPEKEVEDDPEKKPEGEGKEDVPKEGKSEGEAEDAPALDDDPLHEIVVNGVAKKVPLSVLLATQQKIESGDEYLEKAKQNYEKSLKPTQESDETATPDDEKLSEEKDVDVDSLVEEATDAILVGDKEEVAGVVRKLLQFNATQPQEQQVSTEAIVNEIEGRAITRKWTKEYPEIAKGPVVEKINVYQAMVYEEVNRLNKEEGAAFNDYETYKKASDKIVKQLNLRPETPDEDVVDELEAKRKKKKTITTVKPAGGKAGGEVKETKPASEAKIRSDGIKDLKKARGQT